MRKRKRGRSNMSFFKKLAASAGIGAAKVDTILEQDAYYP
ncbi:exported hypothetical protein [Bacillus vallismortis]